MPYFVLSSYFNTTEYERSFLEALGQGANVGTFMGFKNIKYFLKYYRLSTSCKGGSNSTMVQITCN